MVSMFRPLLAVLLLATPLLCADTMEAFGHKWSVPVAADWKVEKIDGIDTLRLTVPRPQTSPRRPNQFAILEAGPYKKVVFEVEVKKEPADLRNRHTSLMFAYAFQDEAHFNYVHVSVDAAKQQPVHNGVFHVFGGERVRISPLEGPHTLEEKWQKVRVEFDGSTGRVKCFVDGQTSPSITAIDESLRWGKIGIGSFFDIGDFRNFKIVESQPYPAH